MVRIFGLQQHSVSNFSLRNHFCVCNHFLISVGGRERAMLPVHTFAYHHQVSGKSYYLFLQRDTIRGGLAVKKNSQPWHLSNRHRIAVIPNACWEISQKDLALGLCGPFFWHCKHFQSTFEQQLLQSISFL